MVRVCLNSNNTTGANVQNVTGHYSTVNWYRCVSHCGAAKELLLCLFVYQLLSQQSKCVSRRNQILQPNLPRWQARKTRRGEKSTRSSKMERWIRNNQKNPHALPSPNLPFRRKLRNRSGSPWTFADNERRLSRTRRISPPQSLARSATTPLRPLLVAELAWSRCLLTANMKVTTRINPLAPRPDLILFAFGRGDKLLLHPSFIDCWELSDDTNRQNPQLWTEARYSLPCHTQSSSFAQKCESLQGETPPT